MIHYSADGTLAVVHGLLPVGRLVIAARLVLVEARHCCGRRLLLRDALPRLNRTPPQILRLRRVDRWTDRLWTMTSTSTAASIISMTSEGGALTWASAQQARQDLDDAAPRFEAEAIFSLMRSRRRALPRVTLFLAESSVRRRVARI